MGLFFLFCNNYSSNCCKPQFRLGFKKSQIKDAPAQLFVKFNIIAGHLVGKKWCRLTIFSQNH